MRILIADDDIVSRHLLEAMLTRWGYEAVACQDGDEAWQAIQREDAPPLAILDWVMPGMQGIDICRKLREEPAAGPIYIILLTAKGSKEEIVEGLEAGADDYITKPFNREELLARLSVGARLVRLQANLTARVKELEKALSQVKRLQGLLPICSYCKKVRNDQNYWQQVESYLSNHSEVRFSHGICPDCYEKYVAPELEMLEDF